MNNFMLMNITKVKISKIEIELKAGQKEEEKMSIMVILTVKMRKYISRALKSKKRSR